MAYLEWKVLDEAWRCSRFLQLAEFMVTWRQTMINMVYICYEGQHWALREAGVQIGLIRPESPRSVRRRILEDLYRERNTLKYTLEGLDREVGEEMERLGRMRGRK